jgi:hypothetical protein
MKTYSKDKKVKPVHSNDLSYIENHFPRIGEKITLMWGAKEFPEYLNSLMIDDRGDREGFPFEVIEEMMFLLEIHDYRLGKRTVVTKDGYRIA